MIEISNGLAIMADNNCYILGRPYINKKGQKVMKSPKYYTTMRQAVADALGTLMREDVESENITTLKDFIRRKEELQKQLTTIIERL